jgi:NAD(P)-dependent dehydrogenase (short-subunit alcohol dehydrogenase family)
MARSLEGRTAIVTAAGAGIGAATARRFAEEGAAVVVTDLSGRRANDVAQAITAAGGRARALKVDVADPEAIQATIRLALDSFDTIDVMVNNAGFAEAT